MTLIEHWQIAVPSILHRGAALPTSIDDQVIDLSISHRMNVTSSCSFTFVVPEDGKYPQFELGDPIDVDVVMGSTKHRVFTGDVRAVEMELTAGGRAQITVEALDRSYQLGIGDGPQVWVDTTATDIVKQLASAAGLTADVQDLSTSPRPYRIETGTGFDILDGIMRRSGAAWFVGKGSGASDSYTKFVVRSLEKGTGGAVIDLEAGDTLRRFSARYSAADEVGKVEIVGGWGTKKQTVSGTGEPNDGQRLSNAAVFTKSSNKAKPKTGVVPVGAGGFFSEDAADAGAVATAQTKLHSAALVRAHGETVYPVPGLNVGAKVKISGVGDDWAGQYLVTSVEHRFGVSRSWTTRFATGAPDMAELVDLVRPGGPGDAARAVGVTVGVVTRLSDSERTDGIPRVKVKLPFVSGDSHESAWARVVAPGAGKERGFMAMPEIDDEVLVAFEQGDLTRPYVLGGLWNDQAKTFGGAAGVKNDKIETRSWVSRTGHNVTISDAKDATEGIVIAVADGRKIEIVKDHILIDSSKPVDGKQLPIMLKGPLQSLLELDKDGNVTIKGQKVTIESAQAMSIKSKLSCAIEAVSKLEAKAAMVEINANATAKLASKAVTEISGMPVKVN